MSSTSPQTEPLSRAEAAAIAIALRERVAEARGVLLWGEQALRVAATLDAARSASDTPRDLREGPCRFCGQPNASDEHYGPASTHSYVATAVVFETALATLDAARSAPLDVDVLARAMDSVLRSQDRGSSLFREDAAAIAAEYLREYAR